MKRTLAILGVICLASILYIESTSFTKTVYWESRHAQESFLGIFSRGFNRNALLITGWNSFVSFVPNILHTVNGIRLNFKRNLSTLKTGMAEIEWYMYRSGLDSSYKDALEDVANYFLDLQEKQPNSLELTDSQLLGDGTNLSDKAKDVLRNYYTLAKAHQLEVRSIVVSGAYTQERSKLWDGLKIHPEYGGDEDALFTKSSKFFARCFVYFVITILIIYLIPIAFGSGKRKNFLKAIKSSNVYQLLRGCIHWSLWRFIVSDIIAVAIGLFFWVALVSGHPNPHDRLILPLVGLFWGSIAGLVTYSILLIFSGKTYNAVRDFLQWKHWKIATSIVCMLAMCLFMTLGMLDASTPKSSERFMPLIVVAIVTLIFGLISFGGLWLISFIVKKVMVWKKNAAEYKEKDEPSDKKELEREKEKLQNQILSLEVAELKKKLADLESKQEKKD